MSYYDFLFYDPTCVESTLFQSVTSQHTSSTPRQSHRGILFKIKKYFIQSGEWVDTKAKGLGPIYPVAVGDNLFFLGNNPTGSGFELFRYALSEDAQQKLPIDVAGGRLGLLFHPYGKSLLLVSNEKVIGYHIETNRYQKVSIPENPVARRFGLHSDFDKIYFSKQQDEWRFITWEDESLVSKSLGISSLASDFDLSKEELEKVSVSLEEVNEAEGIVVTSGAKSTTIRKQLAPFAEEFSEASVNGSSFLSSLVFQIGDTESDYASGASVSFHQFSDQSFTLREGVYKPGSMNDLDMTGPSKVFAEIYVVLEGNYYEVGDGTEGFVEVTKAVGLNEVDVVLNVTNLTNYEGQTINVAAAFKLRQ